MNEQERMYDAQRQMEDFLKPIRNKAYVWLQRNIYPSSEYQILANRLDENELPIARQVLTNSAINLGLVELLRFDPTIKQGLEKVLEPFETSFLFYARYRKILQMWDTTTKPTDLLKTMRDEKNRACEEALQRNPNAQRLKKLMEIEDATLPLIINTYSKFEYVGRVILTDEN